MLPPLEGAGRERGVEGAIRTGVCGKSGGAKASRVPRAGWWETSVFNVYGEREWGSGSVEGATRAKRWETTCVWTSESW